MTSTFATCITSALGLLAVAPGAFGVHGFKDSLTQNGTAAVC